MKKVLYVEDSATSQLLMRKYLNNACDLTITASPQAALTLIGSTSFDLVITDFLFPDGDATDLIVDLRRKFTVTALPIIVVSGSMDLALLARLIKAGANDGMAKPLNIVEFRSMVERMTLQPYVRVLERAVSSVSCYQWSSQGQFFEYCPELDLKLAAPSREEVTRLMLSRLQEAAVSGTSLGYTTHEKPTTHLVQV